MNYGFIIFLFAAFVSSTNCTYLQRFKRFKETAISERHCLVKCYETEIETILTQNNTHFLDYKQTSDFISTANKIIASCHSCGDSPLILDILRSTKNVFNSKEQDYEKVFELKQCARSKLMKEGNIEESSSYKIFMEDIKKEEEPKTACESLKNFEKELTEKMMELCSDKNLAVIECLLVEIRYNATISQNIAYSSIYECS